MSTSAVSTSAVSPTGGAPAHSLAVDAGHHRTDLRSSVEIAPRALIRPWEDPVVDAVGHDPRGWYFERYWLSVIGPTATLVMRRLADRFDTDPGGFVLDLEHCASTMGLSYRRGATSPFGRALQRCVMFGLARRVADGYMVRRWVPDIADRHLQRLPEDVKMRHREIAGLGRSFDRSDLVERLTEVGVPPPVASRAADAARLAS